MRERRVGIVVCRGCCCGAPATGPGADRQVERLRRSVAGLPELAALHVTDCLGPCAEANVMVVRPSPAGRRLGGRPVWLGLVLDEDAEAMVVGFAAAGGPGVAELPAELDLHAIKPPRYSRLAGADQPAQVPGAG